MNNRWRQVRRVRRQEAAKQMRRAREIFEASIKYRDAVYAGLDALGEAVVRMVEPILARFEEVLDQVCSEENTNEKHKHPDL